MLVKLKGKYGFIGKNGKEVTPCKYDKVEDFSEGLAEVYLNGKWGFIDKNGKSITPVEYDGIKHIVPLGIIKAFGENENGNFTTHYYDTTGKYLGSD